MEEELDDETVGEETEDEADDGSDDDREDDERNEEEDDEMDEEESGGKERDETDECVDRKKSALSIYRSVPSHLWLRNIVSCYLFAFPLVVLLHL